MLKIDKSIISKTLCPYNFECLHGDRKPICKIKKDEDVFLCVEPEQHSPPDCPFKLELSTMRLCNCRVRKEIYNKYQI